MSSATFVCCIHRQLVHSCRWKLVYSNLARLISSAAWAVKPMSDTTHHCYCHRQSPSSPLMSTFYSTNASNQSLSLPISTRYQQTHAATPRSEASPPIDTLTIELGETHRQNEMSKVKELLLGIRRGDRAKLAAAITLVESRHPLKHKQAQWLLTKILSQQSKRRQLGALRPTFRIGLSGPPGAGKSTLIESFGQLLTGQGYKVAVLAVDPSSTRTGGSILGDKTRMIKLTNDPNAYIRPSPSGGSLGGVTRSTSEAITLCEGAGYDIIVVETVGVGQSETAVCDMVDMFVLMTPPAAGDELQGMKKGIVELADLILINKADGDLLPAARRIKGEYVSALRLIRSKTPHWQPKVLMLSALSNQGVKEMWNVMQEYWQKMKEVQQFDTTRKNQQRQWLWNHIGWQLKARFKSHPGMPEQIVAMEKRVMAGSLAPGTAADILLDEFIQGCSHGNIK